MNNNNRPWWKVLLQPRIVVPILLTAALLGFAFSITDLPKVIGSISRIKLSAIVISLGLAFAYLVLKGLVFVFFLKALKIFPNWRALLLSYAVGEMALTIPAGIYAQNYVLKEAQGEDFSRSAAATTWMLALEEALALLTLLILGIPHWNWLRPAILAFCGLMGVILLILVKSHALRNRLFHWASHSRFKQLGAGLIEFAQSLQDLLVPRVILLGGLLTVAYLGALVGAFWMIAHGMGMKEFTFLQATTVYLFALGVMILVGNFATNVGVIEVVGLGAAQAWGYSLTEGLAMLLGFRLVWIGSVWLLSAPVVGLLFGLLRRSSGYQRQKPAD